MATPILIVDATIRAATNALKFAQEIEKTH